MDSTAKGRATSIQIADENMFSTLSTADHSIFAVQLLYIVGLCWVVHDCVYVNLDLCPI